MTLHTPLHAVRGLALRLDGAARDYDALLALAAVEPLAPPARWPSHEEAPETYPFAV